MGMKRSFAFGLVSALVQASAGYAQTVSGVVTEAASGLPVRAVGVVLSDSVGRVRMGALSDSLGRYQMSAGSAGLYYLTFRRTGLQPLERVKTTLRSGHDAVVDVALTRSVTTLASVEVIGRSEFDAPPGNKRKYDEFLRRRALGLGTFLTKEDLDSRPRHQMQEIFNGIPGIKVRHNGTQWTLQSQRCSGKSIPGFGIPKPKRDPMFFIDGARVTDIAAIAHISPSEVEAVEVYQGAAQLPAEARGDSCFAIFVWLRG